VIGVDTFASVFGGAPAHTEAHYTEHLRAVIRAGYSPVLCKPGGKETACILSAAQAKKADREAQQRELAMNPAARVDRIRHACGMKHVIDDAAKVGPIVKRFLEVHGGLNVALHLGRSRMLVVDVDTPDERAAFERSWFDNLSGAQHPGNHPPPGITVESPGSQDPVTGQWLHWGGGHWWMPLPEDYMLPPGKVLKGPGGWAAMYGESYALVPPASRREGPYRLVGGTTPPPVWLLNAITEAGRIRGTVAIDRQGIAGGPIDKWSAVTTWASLLEPAGWTETSMTEVCGCPIWTAPGDHASPKSATAHDLACARFDVSEGWGPLKIWTDHPPGGLPPSGAVTKLQFVAATSYGGSDKQAIKGLGIAPLIAPPAWAVPEEWIDQNGTAAAVLTPDPFTTADDFGTPSGPPPDPSVPQAPPSSGSGAVTAGTEAEERPSWAPVDLTPFLDGTFVEPPASLMPRSDGVCLLYPGLTHSIHGESESGKSWIVQAESARVMRNGGTVLYIDFESGPVYLVRRLLDLGCTREQLATQFFYVHPEVKPGTDLAEYGAWSAIFAARFTLCVIDGVTDALGLWGLSTKDNDEFSAFAKQVPRRIAAETGAAVVMVDHVVKDRDNRGRFAIGGQAKMATLDGAAYVVDVVERLGKGVRGVLSLGVAKDRPGGVRGHGEAQNSHRIQPIAEFILDATDYPRSLLFALNPPPKGDVEDQTDERKNRIRRFLRDYPQSSRNEIYDAVKGNKDAMITAIQSMVDDGEMVIERIGQKHTHTLISPIT